MSEAQILDLQKQVTQRDEMLQMMKVKTKEYVAKLKEEHAEVLTASNKSKEALVQVNILYPKLKGKYSYRLNSLATRRAKESH
jgi:hypothetical protein